jgi:hypothetical protein
LGIRHGVVAALHPLLLRDSRMRFFLIAVIAAILLTGHALALDLTQPIEPLTGEPFVDRDGKPVTFTFAKIVADSLLKPVTEDKNDDVDAQVRRYELAKRIILNPADVVLTAEETAMIKQRMSKLYSAGVVGPTVELLDPASVGSRSK